jgi:uncharacterized protein
MPDRETAVVFACGHEQLVGIVHRPAAPTARRIGVLIVVGGPQYRVGSHRQFLLMARRIAEAGYPVLRFDYRGMGDATGDGRTFQSVDEDIAAAIKVLCEQQPTIRGVVALGLCDGASAALMYCRNRRGAAALVLINPWVRTQEGAARAIVRHYYVRRLLERSFWHKLIARELAPLQALRDVLSLARQARRGEDKGPESSSSFVACMGQGAASFKGPVLLLLSGRDLTAREFEDLCRQSAQWKHWVSSRSVTRVNFPDADHTFSAAASLRAACDRIVQWLDTVQAELG